MATSNQVHEYPSTLSRIMYSYSPFCPNKHMPRLGLTTELLGPCLLTYCLASGLNAPYGHSS
jgi:hypothetical protein